MEDKFKRFELNIDEIRELLFHMNRDNSKVGRLNEFTRSIMESLYVFLEFGNKVVKGDFINSDTFDYFEQKLVDALNDFKKLKNIYNKSVKW